MNSLSQKVLRFWNSESGVTAVEYAVLLALIVGACVIAITVVGAATKEHVTDAKNGLSGALNK